MNEEEQIALLATDGMLVKRPLVIGDSFVLTGFSMKKDPAGRSWGVTEALAFFLCSRTHQDSRC